MSSTSSDSTLPTVLITGASQGIGRALAINLASSKKYKLALISRNDEKLCKTVELCEKANKDVKILALICDVTNSDRLKECINKVGNTFGPFAVLINNAGVVYPHLVDKDIQTSKIDKLLRTNLNALIHACAFSIPFLKQTKLSHPSMNVSIIQLSSRASTFRTTDPKDSIYCASKFGVRGFSDALFKELKESGIKVCQIMPGWVKTEMVTNYNGLILDNMIQLNDITHTVNYILNCSSTVCPLEILLCPQKNVWKKSKL